MIENSFVTIGAKYGKASWNLKPISTSHHAAKSSWKAIVKIQNLIFDWWPIKSAMVGTYLFGITLG